MVFGDGKKWNNNAQSESIRDKLREVTQSQTPLKPRIEETKEVTDPDFQIGCNFF